MRILKLMFFLLMLWNCRNSKPSDGSPLVTTDSKVENNEYAKEYLDKDSLSINETLKFKNNVNDLKRLVGLPDSIVKKEDMLSLYNDSTYEVYYYKSYDFLVYNNKTYLDRIKFNYDNVQVKFSSITFNKNTTREDIEKNLPYTYKNQLDTLTIKNLTYEYFWVPVKPKWGSNWYFIFKDNKLVEIEYNMPG